VFKPQIKNLLVKNAYDDDRIILYPYKIPDDEIQIYMNACDIIVTPYRDVLTSGQVILAMSFNKPIIAPKLGCIIDVLDEKGSILYNPNINDSLIQALEKSLDKKANLVKMGNYNFNLVKKFEWNRLAIKTIKIYQKLL
jgi:glycosyltransferase involved in cell wall biosynthesis